MNTYFPNTTGILFDQDTVESLNRVVTMAARLFQLPAVIAMCSSFDAEQQHWITAFPLALSPNSTTFANNLLKDNLDEICHCSRLVLASNQTLIFPDTDRDHHFTEVQLKPQHIRFYAGTPIRLENAHGLKGTLCLIDWHPQPHLSVEDQNILEDLAKTIYERLELRLAKLQKLQSEEKLQVVLNNGMQSFMLINREYRLEAVNQLAVEQSKKLWGHEIRVGDSIFDYVYDWDLLEFKLHFENALTGLSTKLEKNIKGQDGSDNWFEFIYNPVFQKDKNRFKSSAMEVAEGKQDIENSQIVGVCLTVLNINDRKKVSSELEKSENRFRSLVQYSSDIIAVIDEKGLYKYISPAVIKLLGCEPGDLIGHNSFELIHSEDVPKAFEALSTLLANPDQPVSLEFRMSNIDKHEWIYIEAIGTNLINNPSVAGIVINARDVTARKQVEERLHLFERSVGESSSGIVITDATIPDNPAIYVNPAFEMMTGYSKEEILGRNCRFLQKADRNQEGLQDLRKALSEGKECHLNLRNYKSDGTLFWNELRVSPLRNMEGKITNFVGIQTDITAHRKAQAALATQNQVLTMLTLDQPLSKILEVLVLSIEEQSPGMICSILLLDEMGQHLHNGVAPHLPVEYVKAINGIEIGQAVGSCGTAAFLGKMITVADIATDPLWTDYRSLALSHNLRACWSRPILSAKSGKVLGTFACYYSEPRSPRAEELQLIEETTQLAGVVLERWQAEEKLRRSEEQLRLTFELTPTGIAITTLAGRFLQVNPALCRLLGYTEAELLTLNTLDVTHPADITGVLDPSGHLEIGKISTSQEERRYLTKSGQTVYAILQEALLKDQEGKPLHIIAQIVDITQRRHDEEELLKNSKLEAVGLLAGGIAHDFNNILTAVLGNLSLANSYLVDLESEGSITTSHNELKEVLEEAEKASWQAKDLTQQLLTFAKGGTLVKKAAQLTTIIEEQARFAGRGSGVKCDFEIDADLWPVEVDKGQMSQVIQNLVINAIQAMPQGGTLILKANNITLPLTPIGSDNYNLPASPPLPSGNYVLLSVIDQGVGIAPDVITQIFDPYFTTKELGNGLGLASCYSIIRKHGGYIEVKSQLGIGTTFDVYIPANPKARVISLLDGVKIARSNINKLNIPLALQERILVMDDELMVRRTLCLALKHLGYAVVDVGGGKEALELYQMSQKQGRTFKAVIMDLTIPGGVGGKEIIRTLLKLDPDVKAIVSSGYSESSLISDFRQFGFKGVLVKPYTLSELKKVLCDVLS